MPGTVLTERPPFASLLRLWRDSRKQSQLELALAASVSQRHLSFLELGRTQPSREMVNRLAQALDVPLRERNALHAAAGFAAPYRESRLEDADMAAVRVALNLQLEHHKPYPALVVDRLWNVLSGNAAVLTVFGRLGQFPELWKKVCGDGPHNVLKLLIHPEGLRPVILNWDDAAPALLARLRREADALGSVELRALLAELLAYPDVPADWRLPQRSAPPPPVVPLRFEKDGLRLNLFTMISTFGTPQDITTDELRVELFYPADEVSAQLMRAWAGSA